MEYLVTMSGHNKNPFLGDYFWTHHKIKGDCNYKLHTTNLVLEFTLFAANQLYFSVYSRGRGACTLTRQDEFVGRQLWF